MGKLKIPFTTVMPITSLLVVQYRIICIYHIMFQQTEKDIVEAYRHQMLIWPDVKLAVVLSMLPLIELFVFKGLPAIDVDAVRSNWNRYVTWPNLVYTRPALLILVYETLVAVAELVLVPPNSLFSYYQQTDSWYYVASNLVRAYIIFVTGMLVHMLLLVGLLPREQEPRKCYECDDCYQRDESDVTEAGPERTTLNIPLVSKTTTEPRSKWRSIWNDNTQLLGYFPQGEHT